MIKRTLVMALFLLSIASSMYALDLRNNEWSQSGRIPSLNYVSTTTWAIDKNGHFFPGRNQSFDIGSPTQTARDIYAGSLSISSGIVNELEAITAPPSASTTAFINNSVSTVTLGSGGTTYLIGDPILTQPSWACNLVVVSSYLAGSATNTVTGTCVVIGTDTRGLGTTETISFSTTPAIGNVAWILISSITVSCSSITTTNNINNVVEIGRGTRLGLSNSFNLPTDIYQAFEGTTVVSSGTANPTPFNTYDPQSKPNGTTNYNLRYKVKRSVP